MKQQNGNTQLNQAREDYNDRVSTKQFLGKTTRVQLNNKRRYRTI